MSCYNKKSCACDYSIKSYGVCDTTQITIDGSDRTALNWNEISVPEMLSIPIQKPDIENIDQVYVQTDLLSAKLIQTPFAYNQYDILATTAEIGTITAIIPTISAVTATITAVTGAVTTLLGLLAAVISPALIASLTQLNTSITAASTALTTAITNLTNTLAIPNVTIAQICAALTEVIAALNALETLLAQLVTLLNEILGLLDPVVDAAIITAINTLLNTTITAATTAITAALTAISGVTSICAQTTVIVLIPNSEGVCLSGRKIIVEGTLKQKVIYTANVATQSVHSAHFDIPFSTFIIPYAKFENSSYVEGVLVLINGVPTTVNGFVFGPNVEFTPDLCEEFCIEACIEDIFAYAVDLRTVFKNITLFLLAKPVSSCS